MQTIKQLPPHEAQKIAAGEVVERPANVVKELIENAIDARATKISIYCNDAGKALIRVVDNGSGMSREDAQLCFALHATSKINSIADLENLESFGFRGEALASIAAISKTTLITKRAEQEVGTKVIVQGGIMQSSEETACAPGTDIAIHDLLYNVPARQKFLKKDETEWRHIMQLFHAFCLDYRHIHFQLFSDNRSVHNCPPSDDLFTRLAQLEEHNNNNHLIALQPYTHKHISISGIISNHHHARYDRNNIFLFVNKRWVKNSSLSRALLKGYLNVLPAGRYPAAYIFIELDPHEVDINIHPRKEEVMFLHPRVIEQAVTSAVKATLEGHLSNRIQHTTHVEPREFEFRKPSIWQPREKFAPSVSEREWPPMEIDALSLSVRPAESAIAHSHNVTFVANELCDGWKQNTVNSNGYNTTIAQSLHSDEVPHIEHHNIIGIFNKTYILIEQEDGLFLLDQHAAHERILYELFSQRFHEVATIQLLFPQIVTLAKNDLAILEPHLEIFTRNGIGIELFSENQLSITSTPAHLKNVSFFELTQDVISWIKETDNVDEKQFFKSINEKLHAQMACKAAVKAGDTLTIEQAHELMKDLSKIENRFTCPHGRPTGWLMSSYEIEKKFKRKL